MITSPLPPAPTFFPVGAQIPTGYANGFPPSTQAGPPMFCLSGTGALVLTQDGGVAPDYPDIYGIGMGFDFNNVDGVKSAYDAPAFKVLGVQFTLTSGGVFPQLRVEFPTTDTFGIGDTLDPYDFSPSSVGTYTVLWTSLEGPPTVGVNLSYAPPVGVTQPPFDPAHLLSIQFHVPTNTFSSVPVTDLCVSGLSVIVEN
jgi:hypothetical protein